MHKGLINALIGHFVDLMLQPFFFQSAIEKPESRSGIGLLRLSASFIGAHRKVTSVFAKVCYAHYTMKHAAFRSAIVALIV